MLKNYRSLSTEFGVDTDDNEPTTVTEETIVEKLKEISITRSSCPDNLPN